MRHRDEFNIKGAKLQMLALRNGMQRHIGGTCLTQTARLEQQCGKARGIDGTIQARP